MWVQTRPAVQAGGAACCDGDDAWRGAAHVMGPWATLERTRGMVATHGLDGGEWLQRYRPAAGLSQEALAERAGLGARTISELERGVTQRPYQDTVALL